MQHFIINILSLKIALLFGMLCCELVFDGFELVFETLKCDFNKKARISSRFNFTFSID